MRKIGTLEREEDARVFCDHLFGRGVRCEADEGADGGWGIWVYEESQVDEGEEELLAFTRNPSDPRFHGSRGLAEATRRAEAREAEAARARTVDMRLKLGARAASAAGGLTIALIVASVGLFIAFQVPDLKGLRGALMISEVRAVGLLPREVLQGEVWRLLTPILLHFSVLHILFNMMWLHHLGGAIESHEGTRRLGLMVAVMGLVSNLLQYWMAGPMFGGMSGVVYGLFGYTLMCVRFDPASPYELDRVNTVLMIGWFFLCLTGAVGNIANWAHAGGLVIGVAWGAARVGLPRLRR